MKNIVKYLCIIIVLSSLLISSCIILCRKNDRIGAFEENINNIEIVPPLVSNPATEKLPKGPFLLPTEVENIPNLAAPNYLPHADDVAATWELLGLVGEEAPFVKMNDMFCRIVNATSNPIQLIIRSVFPERERMLIDEVVESHNNLFGVINPNYTIDVVSATEEPATDGCATIELSLVTEFYDMTEVLLGRTSYDPALGDGYSYTFPNATIELLQNMNEKYFKSIFTHELYHAFGFGHTNAYYEKTTIMAPKRSDYFSAMLSLKDIKALFAAYGDVTNAYAQKQFNDYYENYAPQYLLDIVNLATAKINKTETKSNIENNLSLLNFGNASSSMNFETGEEGEFVRYDTFYRMVDGKMKIEIFEFGEEYNDYAEYKKTFSREYDVYVLDNTVIVDIGQFFVNGFGGYMCFQRYGTTYAATDLESSTCFLMTVQ